MQNLKTNDFAVSVSVNKSFHLKQHRLIIRLSWGLSKTQKGKSYINCTSGYGLEKEKQERCMGKEDVEEKHKVQCNHNDIKEICLLNSTILEPEILPF